jgi:hypothetical protein
MKTNNKDQVESNNMVGTQEDNIPTSQDNSKASTNSTAQVSHAQENTTDNAKTNST